MYIKKGIVIFLIIVLFIVSIIFGFLIRSFINFSKKEKGNPAVLAEENMVKTVDTSSSDEIVSPNAELVLTQKYLKCGHTITSKEIVPREIVNLNKEKVQEFFKEYNVDSFSSNEISISRNNQGICDEHYVLRESDGYISINCKNNIGEYIFKGLTDISVQYLPDEDLSKLEKGIEIVGRENLNKFLEDFE